MLNLPIKILKTVELETQNTTITIDNINELVAAWDAVARVTSRHLVLIVNARCIDVSDAITNFLRFNGDAGMNYMYQRLSGVGAVASAGRVDGANAINLPPICGANNANTFGGSLFLIPHAFNTVNHKTVLALGGASEFTVEIVAGRWASAAAITSVTVLEGVGDEMEVGSTLSLGVIDEQYLMEEILLVADGQATFDNIPQGEGDLAVVAYLRSDRAGTNDVCYHSFNDDTLANYLAQYLRGAAAVTSAASAASRRIGVIVGDNATPNDFGTLVATYSQYTKDNQPHYLSLSGYHESSLPSGYIDSISGRRANIEPINKLHYEPNVGTDFKAGSLFSLYRVPKRIIERIELTAPQAIITFANIPQNFEAIQLNVYSRTDLAAVIDGIVITLNTDAVAVNYDMQALWGTGAVVGAALGVANRTWFYAPAANEGANEFGVAILIFPNYAKADRHKHCITIDGRTENVVVLRSQRWKDTAPITRIDLDPVTGPNFLAGSVFELEGILKKEGLPPSEGEQWGV